MRKLTGEKLEAELARLEGMRAYEHQYEMCIRDSNTASQNIEGFVYTSMNALYQTNLSFTSQNIGAEKYTRIKKILATCQRCV